LSPVGVGNRGLTVVLTDVCGSWLPWSDWLMLSDWLRESNSSSSASKSEWLKRKHQESHVNHFIPFIAKIFISFISTTYYAINRIRHDAVTKNIANIVNLLRVLIAAYVEWNNIGNTSQHWVNMCNTNFIFI